MEQIPINTDAEKQILPTDITVATEECGNKEWLLAVGLFVFAYTFILPKLFRN